MYGLMESVFLVRCMILDHFFLLFIEKQEELILVYDMYYVDIGIKQYVF